MNFMDGKERRRFESLESLRSAAYNSMNDRRSYEWKLSLSIWTTLAVSIAGILQPASKEAAFPLKGCIWAIPIYALAIAAIVFIHGYWSDKAARRNKIDTEKAHTYEDEMKKMSGVAFSGALQKKIDEPSKREGWTEWSHLAQIMITLILGLLLLVILYVLVQ
jgi:hypothetical protein